jgi:hypothetical protein
MRLPRAGRFAAPPNMGFSSRSLILRRSSNCSRIAGAAAYVAADPLGARREAQMLPQPGILSGLGQTTRSTRRRPFVGLLRTPVGLSLATILPFLATFLVAQTSPASPALEFEQEGHDIRGFVSNATRREDGVERRSSLALPSKSATGRFRLPLPPLEKGSWWIELTAYNDAGESQGRSSRSSHRWRPAGFAARSKSPPAAKGSPKAPPATQKPPVPPKKKGTMGKLWTFIVGDDEP